MSKSNKAQFSAFQKLKNPVFLIVFIFLTVYTISVLFPLAWGFMTSFKEKTDFANNSIFALPHIEAWELNKKVPEYIAVNYDNLFGNYASMIAECKIEGKTTWVKGFNAEASKENIIIERGGRNGYLYIDHFLTNTVLYTVVASILRTLGPMIVAYLCANYRNKFSSLIHAFVIFVMVTPVVGGTAPMLALIRGLGIYNTWFDVFLRSFGFANMYFLVFYAFFASASNAYAEAAEIDGASQFRVMVTIYFPLAMTMFGTVLLIQFVSAWNDYNTALLYLPTKLTFAYAVYYFTLPGRAQKGGPFVLATTMMLAIPTLILFIIFKKKLMGNLSLGGVKE